ncbi:MAG TPA: phage tail protein [Candidatus Deferrimicrobium sp.]|nr:phage tail protein [Candidatus Deferrimicrobium sp.]
MPLFPMFDIMTTAATMLLAIEARSPKFANSLPGIYHEEAEKKHSPLWTLLLLIEDNFASIANILDKIDTYFDTWQAPAGNTADEPDFVSWLGTWVGLVPETEWPEAKRRFVLGTASDLHKYRGTVTGLRCMLALYFGINVQIDEWAWPDSMQVGVMNTSGIDTRIHVPYNINHCFTVTWKPSPEEKGPELTQKIARIRAMIDREKPAHTFCYFNVEGNEE